MIAAAAAAAAAVGAAAVVVLLAVAVLAVVVVVVAVVAVVVVVVVAVVVVAVVGRRPTALAACIMALRLIVADPYALRLSHSRSALHRCIAASVLLRSFVRNICSI